MPVVIGAVVASFVAGVLVGFIWDPIRAIAEVMAAMADVVVSQLPVAADLGLTPTSGWVKGYAMLNTFLPLTEALTLAGLMVALVVAGIALRVAVMVYHLIPKPGMGT